ncbi:hypothetical protein [uncultured Campylobacter sp.]|uniref:hypothetical protein n=1 Tax=uncultured Campylobacter sp. TaxID=218934 RepID=UPI0026034BF1|nr:hypothetical protein [uncultured Campylobacter sp.]
MQEINSRCFIVGLRPHQVIPSRAQVSKLTRLLILLSSRTEARTQTRAAYEHRSVEF